MSWFWHALLRFLGLGVGVLLLSSMMLFLAPGDALFSTVDKGLSKAEVEERTNSQARLQRLGADLQAFVTFNWGVSRVSGENIRREAFVRLFFTLKLTLAAALVFLLLGVGLGLLSALYSQYKNALDAVAHLVLAIPSFGLGALLILVFVIQLRWFNTSGGGLWGLVLPALTAGLRPAAQLYFLFSARLQEVLSSTFIQTARMKGMSEARIYGLHALRAALPPSLAAAGSEMGQLMTGAVVAETLFARKGLGDWILSAIASRDLQILLVAVFLSAFGVALMNLMAEVSMAICDPRMREQESG